MFYNPPPKSIKIVMTIFEKIKFYIFPYVNYTLFSRVDRKRKKKKRARDICKETLDIECERDWSVSLGATLGDGQKIKHYFPGKADSVILLGIECTINTHNLIKIVGAIFEKIRIFYFFLM